jgi:GT2 family glycosyltransferase
MDAPTEKSPILSIVIPNRNGEVTIEDCLGALYESTFTDFEVIVVDDHSSDRSVEIIRRFPCRLMELSEHGGASVTRNRGAEAARGKALFFIDADCVVQPETLELAAKAHSEHPDAVVGGTYTLKAYDKGTLSTFQSAFIHYSETKHPEPDYVATHAMVIRRGLFIEQGGFSEDFMPILEDVEFSHRLLANGVRLLMNPEIQVRHIFKFTLARSLRNAFRKSRYWIRYSIAKRDLAADSGTASIELKADGVAWLASAGLLTLAFLSGSVLPLGLLAFVQAANLALNLNFFRMLRRAGGPGFFAAASLYYLVLYPAPIWAGTVMGYLDAKRSPFPSDRESEG